MSKISFDTLMSVSCFKTSLSFFLPSSVSGLYFNGMSRTTFGFPDAYSTMIFTFSEFLNLHTVAVDSNMLHFKIFFPIILFINVDFPELVSPEKLHYTSFYILIILEPSMLLKDVKLRSWGGGGYIIVAMCYFTCNYMKTTNTLQPRHGNIGFKKWSGLEYDDRYIIFNMLVLVINY